LGAPADDASLSTIPSITLKEVFARFLPQATFRQLRGVGHLSPLEAPDALADACNALLHEL